MFTCPLCDHCFCTGIREATRNNGTVDGERKINVSDLPPIYEGLNNLEMEIATVKCPYAFWKQYG